MSIGNTVNAENEVDLSVVIVCFNDRDVLLPCLGSISRLSERLSFEVIVVDNGSSDGSVKEARRAFGEFAVIEAGHNAGYAGGNNIGFAEASGRYVVFLNPDTLINEGAFDELVSYMDGHSECGAVGPKVFEPDGTLQRTLSHSPRVWDFLADALMLNRIPGYIALFGYRGYRPKDYECESQVDMVAGCCLVARRELLNEIGAFDEGYFIYFEETDLCERIRRNGHKKVVYVPSASIVHLGHATTVKQKTWFKIQQERSRKRFFKKHRSAVAQAAITAILFFRSLSRTVIGAVGLVLTLGRSRRIRSRTAMAFKMLCWQLGLAEHGPRPS